VRALRWTICLLALAAAPACDRASHGPSEATAVSAAPIGDAECAACGMVVREQPPPRGQIAYRDGTRRFGCSVGDLAQVLAVPSPHGAPARVFVESLPVGLDPREVAPSTPTTWVDAASAGYVVGVARAGVMGRPVLAYATPADAERAAKLHGGRATTWEALRGELSGAGGVHPDP